MSSEEPPSDAAHLHHGHPPHDQIEGEYWQHWDEWEESARAQQLLHRMAQLQVLIRPKLEFYYDMDPENLRTIKLPSVDFPEEPEETASYEEKHEYALAMYRATIEVALPGQFNAAKSNEVVNQTPVPLPSSMYDNLRLPNKASSIRLIDVLPGEEDQPISVELYVTDLEQLAPQYEALSYVWGSDPKAGSQSCIQVNGSERPVTENLLSALSSLRHSSKRRTLWVDSLCINQSDLLERSVQVMLMAKIYSHASTVVIHLGPSTPASTVLFKLMQSPDLFPKRHTCQNCCSTDDVDQDFWRACHFAGPELIEGFIDVFSRAWWSRVWILQEYTFSKQDPVFYCGRLSLSNQLLSANFWMLHKWASHRKMHKTPLKYCDHPACSGNFSSGTTLEDGSTGRTDFVKDGGVGDYGGRSNRLLLPKHESASREWAKWGALTWSVSLILARRSVCRPWSEPRYFFGRISSKCSDTHDLVYGIREIMEPLFKDMFVPDYTLPISSLFKRLAVYLLVFDMWTDMFWHYPYRLKATDYVEDVPSWVPDFRRPQPVRKEDQWPTSKNVTRSLPSDACILDGVLMMSGWLLDEIVDVFHLPANDPPRLLQQLWHAERQYGNPVYLTDFPDDEDSKYAPHERRFNSMINEFEGIVAYPSIEWAIQSGRGPKDISIVDILCHVVRPEECVLPITDKYLSQVRGLAVFQEMSRDEESNENTKGGENHSGHSELRSNWNIEHVWEMEDRLLKLMKYLLMEIWVDFVGICVFDYPSFRSQVLHRTVLWHRKEANFHGQTTNEPFMYEDIVAHIEKGCSDPWELAFREAMVVELAASLNERMTSMVGIPARELCFKDQKGHAQEKDKSEAGFEDRQEDLGNADLAINDKPDDPEEGEHTLQTGISASSQLEGDYDTVQDGAQQEHTGGDTANEKEKPDTEVVPSFPIPLPHEDREYQSWRVVPKDPSEVDVVFQELVEFLAGRKIFVTAGGLMGLADAGTQDVEDGDDLLLLQGMSFPLIARLEPSTLLGNPKKRRWEVPTKGMRREILGTAVVKNIDPKGGRLSEVTWPEGFVPLSGEETGIFRFK